MCPYAQHRLRYRQEDPSLSSQRVQEIRCPQRQRARDSHDAQQVKFLLK